jgi:hypothetical protein
MGDPMTARVTLALALAVVLAGCAGPAGTSRATPSGIQRATTAGSARDGHFSDPYPLSGSTSAGGPPTLTFTGTFDEIITCTQPVRPGCFTPSDITVAFDPGLQARIDTAGSAVHSTKAHHVYHRGDGSWDMVLTSEITKAGQTWNVIFHARPTTATSDPVPRAWTVDTVLSGALDHPGAADYDGKLYDDGPGGLYLVYSGALSSDPPVFGVVAERLLDAAHPSSDPPVTLLAPDTGDRALNSENRFGVDQQGGFKLTETGNITKLGDKYVMVYAVGAFDRPDYKIGIAWSDTLLPTATAGWRKIRLPDPTGVWGQPGRDEVRYLLQAQLPGWPGYVAADVRAPGVGSLVQADDRWYLFFAGYCPDEPLGADGTYAAAHRQPYYVPVTVDVPATPTVTAATDAQLASWITTQEGTA